VKVDGEILESTLRGRFKQEHQERVLVGDCVQLRKHRDGSVTIEALLPRHSVLRRRTPGKTRGERVVAANVDQVIVVGSARQPEWDPHLVDRFVVVAEANGLHTTVVVNKCDLCDEPGELARPYVVAGYQVVLTSVPDETNLGELKAVLKNKVSLLTGPTGVGKSSLLNALQPGLRLRTGAVSHKSHHGRHTTVAAEMHPFGALGYVVDTPGLRDIGLWGVEPLEVALAFPEFGACAAGCRFDNCRHLDEPGCAVVEAVANGAIAESRLSSYRQLLDEAIRAAKLWR
jgi:ribosome biogenesis GTPase